MLILWPMLFVLLDFVALSSATIIGYYIRFNAPFTNIVPIVHVVPSFSYYLTSGIIAGAFWSLFLVFRGAYKHQLGRNLVHSTFRVLIDFYLGFAFLFALLFFYRDFLYSRVVAIITLVVASILIVVVRVLLSSLQAKVLPSRPLYSLYIVGPNHNEVKNRLDQQKNTGLKYVDGFSGDPGSVTDEGLDEKIMTSGADTVILAYPFNAFAKARLIVNQLVGHRLNFLYAPDYSSITTSRLSTLSIAGIPMLQLREDPLAGWNGILKRSFDFLLSFCLMVFFSPLFFLLALLVKLTSRGPAIYKQTRVGLDGTPFTILKFRTMRLGAETDTGPVWAKKHDSRKTVIGGFLRRWSLDELPQLWNVFVGQMSLIGPRPERPSFVEKFEQEIPSYAGRHRVKSGMTGWAQVNGLRGQASIEDRTRYDMYYVENWSLGFDLRILAKTMIAVISGGDAY